VLARLHGAVRGRSALVAATMYRLQLLAAEWRAHPPRPFRRARAAPARKDPAADPRLPALMDALHRRIAARTPRLVYLYIPSVDYFGPRAEYGEPRVAAFYHAFAARNHVTLVDVFEPFCAEFARTGQPLHGFPNSVMGTGHLNAAGHRAAGERLARAIAEVMR
jgi:lysophospholipase L1-like esterase